MINSFKGNKKKNIFWNKVYFQIVPVIIVSFLGLAVGVRESCTVCQQAFSTLAKDSASHLVQMDPTWLCLFTVGSYSDVCGGKKPTTFCIYQLLGYVGRWQCVYFLLLSFLSRRFLLFQGFPENLTWNFGVLLKKTHNTTLIMNGSSRSEGQDRVHD